MVRTMKSSFYVVVAAPKGLGGKGGIARLMDGLSEEFSRVSENGDVTVRFEPTRGSKHLIYSVFYMIRFCSLISMLKILGKIDLLHINVSVNGSTRRKLIIYKLVRFLKIPYVLHLHGGEYPNFVKNHPNLLVQIKTMFSDAEKVLVLGGVWKRFVCSVLGVEEDRAIILHNSTKKNNFLFVRNSECVNILFIGNIVEKKGVFDLINALSKVDRLIRWKAIFAGDGLIAEAKELANRKKIGNSIEFVGWLDKNAIEQLLGTSHILVLPSYVENLPMSIIEGMAAGLAVVATPVGAVDDIVLDGVNGVLTPVGNVGALSDVLSRLIKSPRLRRKLGDNAILFHSENLEIGKYACKLKEIWLESS